MLAIIAVFVGLAVGKLAGGSFRALGTLRLRHELVILLVFVVQGVSRGRLSGFRAMSVGMTLWVASSILLIVMLVPAWRISGMWSVILGIGSNLVVVLLNYGMPVVVADGLATESAVAAKTAISAGFYRIAGPGLVAGWLADAMPLSVGGSQFYASVGDLLLVVGVAMIFAGSMRRRAPSYEAMSLSCSTCKDAGIVIRT